MTAEKLRELYHARPFQPFIIHLADGREIPVPHPEWMMIVPNGRTVFVTRRDSSVNYIDVMLITDIEVKSHAKTKSRNGH